MTPEPVCPICGGSGFAKYNTRELAQCRSCKSLERTRLLWLILNKLDVLHPRMRILHVAPERCLMARLGKGAALYLACDFEPDNYTGGVQFIDLCTDLAEHADATFDLIIHNHVLEHVQCDVVPVIRELRRVLKPDGNQFFSVPFRGDITEEDLDPDLPSLERRKRFGQEDHMRIFGRKDFVQLLHKEYGAENLTWTWSGLIEREEANAARVPEYVVDQLSGHTIFRYRKPPL